MNRGLIGALSLSVAFALLGGCGGSQPPIGAPGAMPQSRAIGQHAALGKSWMLPEAKSGDLLYVSSLDDGLYVFTYPNLKAAGHLEIGSTDGLCSAKNGDVFVVQFETEEILEYPHGGSQPSNILYDTGNSPWACSVDPTTGNLAVVGGDGYRVLQNVAIFPNSSGSPIVYTYDRGIFIWCAYDEHGNLFITNGNTFYGTLFELPKGSGSFSEIPVDKSFGDNASLQWDGKYLAIEDAPKCCPRRASGPLTVYQVQISASAGTVVKTLTFDKATNKNRRYDYGVQFWIDGGALVAPKAHDTGVGLWRYPSGGSPVRRAPTGDEIYGVTVSRGTN